MAFFAVDVASARGKLANASALRVDRAGDAAAALAGFRQATELAPSYAWGWYNRAALASRLAGKPGAASSLAQEARDALRRAVSLDRTLARRACGDADFRHIAPAAAAVMSCTA